MSSVKFSQEQLSVIENKNGSVLVSAAAGSGKSTVLVERIIRTVCEENCDIDKLLVVTFTKAAANGMKEKISKALKKKIAENPSDSKLKKQLLLLNACNISTVHSFCTKMLEKYSYYLPENVPVNYSIIDETENALMRQEVLDDLLDELYEAEDDDFAGLVERYAPGRDDKSLNKLVFGIYNKITSAPFYFNWLDNAEKLLLESGDFENSIYGEYICKYISDLLKGFIKKYDFALEYIANTDGIESYESFFLRERALMKEVAELKGFNEMRAGIQSLRASFDRLPNVKKGADGTPAKDIRNFLKDELTKINTAFFERDEDAAGFEADACYPVIAKLFSVIKEFDIRYRERKYSKNYLDFNDLEQLTLGLLCDNQNLDTPSQAAREIRESFAEILVDEYQDTNEVQEAIFNLVSSNGENLVMVGDVKQSIYRFRQANPELFLKRRSSYSEGNNGTNINLNCNYRSRKSVLDFVNGIFDYVMTESTSGLSYKATERLKYFDGNYSDDTEGKFNSEILLAVSGYDEKTLEEKGEILEARAIAKRIKDIIADDNFRLRGDNGQLRRAEYRDIVILVRSFNAKTAKFLDELKKLGIPVSYDEKTSFFETPEIKIVTALLRVVDNPYDDISLLSVMKNVYFFTDEEFLKMRNDFNDKSFYEILKKKQNEPKIRKLLSYLDELRDYSITNELYKLMEKIYKDTYIRELQLGYINGDQKNENLKLLTQIAKNYEKSGYKGISSFIAYVNKIIESEREINAAALIDGNRNTVDVMTIHKSKGLEFPIVILAGCNKPFNIMDMRERILVDKSMGIGCDYFDLDKRYKYPTLVKNVLKIKEKTETLREELRILYVALTRAQEKLIVSGALGVFDEDIVKFSTRAYGDNDEMSCFDFLKAKSYFDFILPALIRHKQFYENGMSGYLDAKNYGFNMDLSIVVPEELEVIAEEIRDENLLENSELPEEFVEKINRYTQFEYETELTEIPQKISVSDARKLFDVEADNGVYLRNVVLNDIRYSEGEIKNSAMTGTVLHYIFEKIDFDEIRNKGANKAVCDFYESNEYVKENLTIDEAKKAALLFESDIGKKMLTADNIYREKDFLITVPAKKLYPEIKSDESIILQGVMDCYFEYDGKFILLDYKYTKKSSDYLKKTYEPQLEMYKEAIKKTKGVTGKIDAYIWNIDKCELIEV
ncbi:MAG: helicase-exonuclease AddAB subunit AddA [Clostridia bacterium]|nr:helicase-exonuclease AddAB subunit AddA [Clostridia bacterium]